MMTRNWSHGWNIVAALAITETVSYGILYYAFSVYIEPLEVTFGWNRAEVSLALSIGVLVSGLLTIPVGIWLDTHSARGVMTIGSIIGALGFAAFSQVTTLWGLYLVWGLLGVAMAAVFYDPAFVVATKWLPNERSRAIAWITLTAGFASTIFLPLTTWLFETYGRINSQLILAAILAVVTIPLHALVLRPAPKNNTDNTKVHASTTDDAPDVLRDRSFWLLTIGFSLAGIAAYGSRVHAIPLFLDLEMSPAFAATAAGIIGGMQVFGRAIYIPLSSYLKTRITVILLFLFHGLATLLLYLFPNQFGVWSFVALSGAAAGALTLIRPVLLGDLYGPEHFGRINGYASIGQLLAITAGPLAAGALYTASNQSYDSALIVFTVICGVAALAILGLHD